MPSLSLQSNHSNPRRLQEMVTVMHKAFEEMNINLSKTIIIAIERNKLQVVGQWKNDCFSIESSSVRNVVVACTYDDFNFSVTYYNCCVQFCQCLLARSLANDEEKLGDDVDTTIVGGGNE